MTDVDPEVGDAVLVESDGDGRRVKGRIQERTRTHATIDIEKRFDSRLNVTKVTDETRVIVLNEVLKVFDGWD
jgi:hypothetical protein